MNRTLCESFEFENYYNLCTSTEHGESLSQVPVIWSATLCTSSCLLVDARRIVLRLIYKSDTFIIITNKGLEISYLMKHFVGWPTFPVPVQFHFKAEKEWDHIHLTFYQEQPLARPNWEEWSSEFRAVVVVVQDYGERVFEWITCKITIVVIRIINGGVSFRKFIHCTRDMRNKAEIRDSLPLLHGLWF